jgi:hypothetical protein
MKAEENTLKKSINMKLVIFTLLLAFGVGNAFAADDSNAISLAGKWEIRMDESGVGIEEEWFEQSFGGDPATLPGTVDTNPRRKPATSGSIRDFTAIYNYQGAVWYQREVNIPKGWSNKEISLFFERCQWETFLWLDDQYIGTRNSLLAPHIYKLPGQLKPGKHRITILVDNANKKGKSVVKAQDIMDHYDLSQDDIKGAKLNCGGHHTLFGYNWNGILGKMEMRVVEAQHLASLDVYPDIKNGAINIKSRVENGNSLKSSLQLRVRCSPLNSPDEKHTSQSEFTWKLSGDAEQSFNETLSLKKPIMLWDEFSPDLYLLSAELYDKEGVMLDRKEVRFGMREIGREGLKFTVNGRPTFMRATLENFIFPLTAYPPMDVESWCKIISVAKSYGLNMFRFHSCTPPDAAFRAADELGFYFQVEVPGTSCPVSESSEVTEYLFEELKHLVYTYGNHPSLLFVSMGNEQLVTYPDSEFFAQHKANLMQKVAWGQKADSRHLYTCSTHPYTPGRNDDFYVSAWGPERPSPLTGIRWSGGTVIDWSRFNTEAPNTTFDYREAIEGIDRPVMSHEVGQWMVYPDLKEISRYHVAKRAFNFEAFREDLRKKGRLEQANDYMRSSGQLAVALYREEIESALRTPNMGGFQLLDLHDYPGQGTSTVGILNSLWESKGLITPEEFRSSCGPVVALARLDKRTWTNTDQFQATLELSNYGPSDLPNLRTIWRLQDSRGHIYASGEFEHFAAQGELSTIGKITADLSPVQKATKLRLNVETLGSTSNSWDLWVYPDEKAMPAPEGIRLIRSMDKAAIADLKAGGMVLLCPETKDLKDAIPGTFTSVFWNSLMKSRQVSKTMGILCDPANPALADFPTEFHSNWQWWDIVMKSSAVRLDSLPAALRPIVKVVDSPHENRRLAMIFEAKVGSGRLLFCATDIISDLESRPVARQLRLSLLKYMASPMFYPDVDISVGDIEIIIK